MLAAVRSATLVGVDGHPVTVEVHVGSGLPAYQLVGLPDAAARESRDRVRAAMQSCELEWPNRKVTVNLAPADVRKVGAGLETAIAVGILQATGGLPDGCVGSVAVLGELGLDGSIRPVRGALCLVDALARAGTETVVVPERCAHEASLVPGVRVLVARNLPELRDCLKGEAIWPDPEPAAHDDRDDHDPDELLDLADVRGHSEAVTAVTAAAAGGHHLLMLGPPGVGKTMLARRLATVLPPLRPDEALEVTRIRSVAGGAPVTRLHAARPVRAPHHTTSVVALVGGGSGNPRPGEITMAHRGLLFLDELGEFPPRVLEALRQPLEEGAVRIARQHGCVTFPARFLLVACSNPCPCARAPAECLCTPAARTRYARRLSAPLLDRFDLRLHVLPPPATAPPAPSSATVRAQVMTALETSRARLQGTPWRRTAEIPAGALDELCVLERGAPDEWARLCERRRLSGRGAAAVRRVARTLADLDGDAVIAARHLRQAADLREAC